MKSILMREDLWDLVDDITVLSGSSSGGKGKFEGIESPPSPPLTSYVELDMRIHIEDENDPRAAWKSLLALFQTKAIADTLLILNRWELLRMEEQMDIATFFTKVYEIRRDLQLAGHPQTTGVMVHCVLSRLPIRFKHLVQQIWSERVMPTLEELHTRLQMEENFQIGERSLDCSDPEEVLVMRIRKVVRRRFSQNPQSFGNYSRIQGQGNYYTGR
jgi:hypothetical protein